MGRFRVEIYFSSSEKANNFVTNKALLSQLNLAARIPLMLARRICVINGISTNVSYDLILGNFQCVFPIVPIRRLKKRIVSGEEQVYFIDTPLIEYVLEAQTLSSHMIVFKQRHEVQPKRRKSYSALSVLLTTMTVLDVLKILFVTYAVSLIPISVLLILNAFTVNLSLSHFHFKQIVQNVNCNRRLWM